MATPGGSLVDDHNRLSRAFLDRCAAGAAHPGLDHLHSILPCSHCLALPPRACRCASACRSRPLLRPSCAILSLWFGQYIRGGFCFAADFVCTARRYWLTVFPRVALRDPPHKRHLRRRFQTLPCAAWRLRHLSTSAAISRERPLSRRLPASKAVLSWSRRWWPARRSATTWTCSLSRQPRPSC